MGKPIKRLLWPPPGELQEAWSRAGGGEGALKEKSYLESNGLGHRERRKLTMMLPNFKRAGAGNEFHFSHGNSLIDLVRCLTLLA